MTDDGRTHWEGCHCLHHGCAIELVDALRTDLAAAKAENERLREEVGLLTHKIITCGVAASHPDSSLSRRPRDYNGKWDSPQAQQVRELRADRDALRQDAERYRWLRAQHGIFRPQAACVFNIGHDWANVADGQALDRDIDAAMSPPADHSEELP